MSYIDKGTDTDALSSYWFSAEFTVDEGITVTKIEAICGTIKIEVENPTSPVVFNLTREQTRQLKCGKNIVHLYGYDGDGKRFKFNGFYEFLANPEE